MALTIGPHHSCGGRRNTATLRGRRLQGEAMTRPQSGPAGDSPVFDMEVMKISARPSAQALSDSQVLRVLEHRRSGQGGETAADIHVLPPEDTSTRLVLREAVARNAPVAFAVQLQWSVSAIDVKLVPRHPIFSAYTLYAAEGRRGGRAWFFLRLGFFSDAVAAKQVAQFLRANFASAAVVPVSPQEQEHATRNGRCSGAATVARSPVSMRR